MQDKEQGKAEMSVEALSFEDALGQLEAIVQKLEAGDITLDKAIDSYQRGMELKEHCQNRLEEARLKVDQIKLPKTEGEPLSVQPFDDKG